jgi:hypothetical protein
MPYKSHVSGWSVLWDKLTRGSIYPSAVEMLLYLSQIVDEGTRADREKVTPSYLKLEKVDSLWHGEGDVHLSESLRSRGGRRLHTS